MLRSKKNNPVPTTEQRKDEFDFHQYEAILSAPEGAEAKFAKLLETTGKGRLTLLYKNLKHVLEKIDDDDTRDKYLYVILKAVAELTVTTNRLDKDELCDVVHGFLTEARHYPPQILAKFSEDCLARLKSNLDTNHSPEWVEIFGRVVGAVSTCGNIEFEDDFHTGKQFKSEVVYSILRIKWTTQSAPSLVACLREIGVDEVGLLLDKVSTSLESMDPNCLPPLTYQLLTVLGDNARFSQYMNILDAYFDRTSPEAQEYAKKCKVLGTVVFHFAHATKVIPNLRLEILKRVKCASPEMVTKRFSLGVSLCLTQFEDIRSTVVNGLKCAIVKGFVDSELQTDTYWYKSSYETVLADPAECFKTILQSKSSELEFMLEGFKELGLGLVALEEKDGLIREKCRSLASVILAYVLRISREEFGNIALKLLQHKNLASIECLAELIKENTRALLRHSNMSKFYELVHQLPLLTLDMAIPLVRALLPALALSNALMGEAILIFRKSLWKSLEARRVSVSTMILLLSKLQIKCATTELARREFMADTQLSFHEAPVSSEANTMNQLLCSEIVSILNRFFSHGRLRDHLYLGLESVLMKNVDLITDISAQLLNCMKQHMTGDGKTMKASSIFQSPQEDEGGAFTPLEDLGLLFQAVCSMIRITEREFVEGDWPAQVIECQQLIYAAAADILTYNLDKFEANAERLRIAGGTTVEMTRYIRNILIAQWMQVLEALVEHILRGGNLSPRLSIIALDEKFQELQKLLKDIGKSAQKKEKAAASKKSAKKDKADGNATANTSTNPAKGPNGSAKVKLDPIKKVVYAHIINLESIQYTLEALYKDQEIESPIKLVQNNSFEEYIFKIIDQKLSRLNHNESINEFDHGKKFLVKTFLLIVRALLDRIMKCIDAEEGNSSTFWNDDEVVLLDAETGNTANNRRLALILEILQFINKHKEYRNRIMQFMSLDKTLNYETDFKMFYQDYWFKLFSHFKNDDANMAGLEHLTGILSILLTQLMPSSPMADQVWEDLSHWLLPEGKLQEDPTPSLVENTVKCVSVLRTKIPQKSDLLIDLAKHSRLKLENNDEMLEIAKPVKPTWVVLEKTAPAVLKVLSLWAEKMLQLVASVISRIKSRSSFVSSETICSWFDHCIALLSEVMYVVMELAGSKFPRGVCGDILLRVSTQFFTTVTGLAEEMCHFITVDVGEIFSISKFKKLVREIGREFKQRVDFCVHFFELIEREEACEAEEKMKADKKRKGKVNMRIVRKFGKDIKTIPALVYSVEKYDLQILYLGKKAKTDLFVGTRLSATRDFRIEMNAVRRAIQEAQPTAPNPNATRNRVINEDEAPGPSAKKRKRKTQDPENEH